MRRKNIRGFTLIELIVTMNFIGIIFLLLISGLFYGNLMNEREKVNQKNTHNERYLNLYFQKQILESDKIILFGNRVYLQDLETPTLYNYYAGSSNGILRRYKANNNSNMTPIGSGGNSQFADTIEKFSMVAENEKFILLTYTIASQKNPFQREIRIYHGRPIEKK